MSGTGGELPRLGSEGSSPNESSPDQSSHDADVARYIGSLLNESCPVKAAISGVGGGVIGGLFGLFMASIDTSGQNQELQKSGLKEQIKHVAKDMGRRGLSSSVNFALIGSIFSGSECIMQDYRAKDDLLNPAAAGCFTGGVLSAKAGPKAAIFGCVGFSAFSVAIEYWLKGRNSSND